MEVRYFQLAENVWDAKRGQAVANVAIYFKMADLMNADVDVIFYDTNSLQFEVDKEDEIELYKQGRGTSRDASAGIRRTNAPTRRRTS